MSGMLGLTSTLGQGSTFSIELPRVEGPVERYERLNGRTEPHVEPAAQRQVVHIEDNLSDLTLVERVLAQRAGIEVVAAMQGAVSASSSPASTKPSWCCWTAHLARHGRRPWSSQRLRDDRATGSIPAVVVSADATPGEVQRLLSAGARCIPHQTHRRA